MTLGNVRKKLKVFSRKKVMKNVYSKIFNKILSVLISFT